MQPLAAQGVAFLRSDAGLPNVYQDHVLPGNPADFRAFCYFSQLFHSCKGRYTALGEQYDIPVESAPSEEPLPLKQSEEQQEEI